MSNQVNIEGKVNGYVIDYGYDSKFRNREEHVYLTWAEVIAQLQARPLPFMVLETEDKTPSPTAVEPSA